MPIAQGWIPKLTGPGGGSFERPCSGSRRSPPSPWRLTQVLLDDGEAAGVPAPASLRRSPPGWSYQLQGTPRMISGARVYDVDGFDTPRVVRVAAAQAQAVCDLLRQRRHVGGLASRPAALPRLRAGPQQRLARRAVARHPPARRAHPDHARPHRHCAGSKGFDAVEPDNVDGYANETGFPLTCHGSAALQPAARPPRSQRRHGGRAEERPRSGHSRCATDFDFAVVEQCFQYDECDKVRPFTRPASRCSRSSTRMPRSELLRPRPRTTHQRV